MRFPSVVFRPPFMPNYAQRRWRESSEVLLHQRVLEFRVPVQCACGDIIAPFWAARNLANGRPTQATLRPNRLLGASYANMLGRELSLYGANNNRGRRVKGADERAARPVCGVDLWDGIFASSDAVTGFTHHSTLQLCQTQFVAVGLVLKNEIS